MKSRTIRLTKDVFVGLAEALHPEERWMDDERGGLVLLTPDKEKVLILTVGEVE